VKLKLKEMANFISGATGHQFSSATPDLKEMMQSITETELGKLSYILIINEYLPTERKAQVRRRPSMPDKTRSVDDMLGIELKKGDK